MAKITNREEFKAFFGEDIPEGVDEKSYIEGAVRGYISFNKKVEIIQTQHKDDLKIRTTIPQDLRKEYTHRDMAQSLLKFLLQNRYISIKEEQNDGILTTIMKIKVLK